MDIVLNNIYLLVWAILILAFGYLVYNSHAKAKKKAEEAEEEYDILKNSKFWKLLIGGIILVVLYSMILPVRNDLSNYNEQVDFISDFEEVTEEDKVRHGVDLSDEARSARLEDLRLQNERISEEVEKEYEEEKSHTKQGDNQ